MADITEPNVIDLVGCDAAGRYLVIMVEPRLWGGDSSQPAQLRAKLDTYTAFITGGGLAQHYPETAGQPADIQLDCASPPTGEVAAILELAERELKLLGIGLRVNVWDADPPG